MNRALLAIVLACGGGQRPLVVMSTNDPAEYPGVLHDPHTLPRDFMVRQSLKLDAINKNNGKRLEAEFDAVVQKQGDKLLVLGLGPMNMKVFTITQLGSRIEFQQFRGPKMPFSPRNILLDVHRVFFKRLPPPAAAYSGVLRGELDGEHVEETWQAGELRERVFTRPGSQFRGGVRVAFGSGCTAKSCEPQSATIRNEWFDYTLAIENNGFESL